MYYLEETYGNDGFAVFIKLLRELARTDYHYLDLSQKTTIMFLSAKCKVSKNTLESIINDLVDLEKFDRILWEENNIIWCQDFIDSIQDAYSKRSNSCITYEGLLNMLISKGIRKPSKSTPKTDLDEIKPVISESKRVIYPQSIVKYSKEEKTKSDEFLNSWSEEDEKFKKFLCEKFKVSEINQPGKFLDINRAIHYFKNQTPERDRWFRDQCYFYFRYKETSEEKTHSLNNFLKGEDGLYESGGWNNNNWIEKFEETKPLLKPNVQPSAETVKKLKITKTFKK